MKQTLLALLAFVFIFASCDFQDPNTAESDDTSQIAFKTSASSTAGGAKPMVLRLKGTADAVIADVPDPKGLIGDQAVFPVEGEAKAFCFTVDMIDVNQDKVVGEATDCITVIGTVGADPNVGLLVVGTTTFDFGNGHTFTTQGLTTVQPTTHGSPSVTHITGAIPGDGAGSDVIASKGKFKTLAASARLSGAVNLTYFDPTIVDPTILNQMTFDCLFVVSQL